MAMSETEKNALRTRMMDMTTDEILIEIGMTIWDEARPPCAYAKTLGDVIHGNGRMGLCNQVRYLRWAMIILAATVCMTPTMGPIYKLVMLLLGR